MADRGGSIQLQGLDTLHRAFALYDKAVVDAALKGLEEVGRDIVADAKDNLRENGSVVTGLLRASGHAARNEKEVVVGFFDTTNRNSGYALYVEYGRRAGKMPPPDELAAWAYKKYHLKDWRIANAMGWAMAKKIAAEGTEPHAFFTPAVRKNQSRIEAVIRDFVSKRTK